MTQAFQLLHPTVQRKLWDMKWTELRQIQVDAIAHLLGGTATDCIIASPTASGKTEAAFLPVLSAIADEPSGSVRAMYVGPLKALINDQFGRIEQLCERMEMPVCRWHGDVDDGPRKALLARPAGILLITPESLEAMFVLRSSLLPSLFGRLAFVVIDEMHAFLGSPRGAQLISQLHRLRVRTGADPIRIGLSATLGDPAAACRWLRRDGRPVRMIESKSGGSEIRLKLRGYWRRAAEEDGVKDDAADPTTVEIARAILLACHGKTNLVFANSKTLIEEIGDELATQAHAMALADEIVVHHGSLSKEQREHAEDRLRSGRPCTAVCSNTLELGIDIGAIDEVVQVSPPWSVASLVQRLGRSGRRPGTARVLRGYFVEDFPNADSTTWDRLHLDFIRGVATIELMLEGWLEPPEVDRANLSTLVQQVLSTLAQTGGIRAHELYPRMAESGAFVGVSKPDFVALLRELGARDLIEQLPDATLVLGLKGQRIVEHYSFYAAFKSATEFQVSFRDRVIGTLPESTLPTEGEHLILAGRRWLVDEIDAEHRKVLVSPSRGRRPPRFASGQPDTDPNLHARMRLLLGEERVPTYLDETGAEILQHARAAARHTQLDAAVRVLQDRTVMQLWAGTRIHRTLWLALASAGIPTHSASDVALEIFAPSDAWATVLRRFADGPDGAALARFAEERLFARITEGEKFDVFLPSELWRATYVRERLDLHGAVRLVVRILAEAGRSTSELEPRSSARAVAIAGLASWAEQVVALEARAVLPTRIVLVPSEAHAHALRAELAERAPPALAGTRFFTAAAAARAVLDAGGIAYTLREEARRSLRVRKVLLTRPSLASYRVDDLCTPGWESAFASTIEQLEAAALRPEDIAGVSDERMKDLATIWRMVDADAGSSWTASRALCEATALLGRQPTAWPFDAPVLAAVPLGIDTAHAKLLQTIPHVTAGVLVGRPARRHALARIHTLLGAEAAELIGRVPADRVRSDELGLLAEFLFEAPDRLASPLRRRSAGPDGTVTLELHAGVDEELDAVARWVAEEVFEHGTLLQDIAILVPTPDPLTTLLADRIGALPWPPDVDPVYLPAGRPATATSGGARLLALLHALHSCLPAEAMLELLPRFKLTGKAGHLSPGRARDVVGLLGTIGGSVARPDGALEWRERVSRPERDERVAAVAPAVEALASIVGDMINGAGLASVWNQIRSFATTHLIHSDELSELVDELDQDVAALAHDPVVAGVIGPRAVELVVERLHALRLHRGRFGEASIFVGTITSAAGLRFDAVRVIGLAEGAFPGTLREDAILPVELRRQLPPHSITSDDDYLTGRLHALDQIVRGTTKRLVLSAPRTDLDASEREPASMFVEVAAALARPDANTGGPARVVPTIFDLERDAFQPARATAITRRLTSPLLASCWLQRVATERTELPSAWTGRQIGNPLAVIEREGTLDGLLGGAPLAVPVWGTSEYPMSASALRILLACPQRFLLERMIGFRPRSDPPSGHRIDPMTYGALFHEVVEAFGREHGAAFGARDGELAHWIEVADAIAFAAFDAFATMYPLISDGVVDSERRRLRRDMRTFVEHDWCSGRPRAFVAVERSFGEETPVAISTALGPLFVKGRIDRLDIDAGLSLVRDFKTGRARPRERELFNPDVDLDLQLAVYAAVTQQLAGEWGVPSDVAASYVYVDRFAAQRERAFQDDRHALHAAGRRWFEIAFSMVREQVYVKSVDADECARCPFSAVCGDEIAATAAKLEDAVGTLAAFRDLKA
jgi:ATP-dependent Lhr-like helicase